ncbi:hypothetical protein ANANG_G00074020 [Anguilla anguilla]|uniref:Uncharacterized protein n=1 Tax=Anguilla anguilla TaxID=7936 RepID=A0A9D3MTD9_ANGAN|nr:hypothetical protein ANANG_G00074020 [Anguilla anguilla]
MSQPCCMKAPRENHRLLKMPNSLVWSELCWGELGWACPGWPEVEDWPCWGSWQSSRSSACHSYGLKRLTRNSTTLTPM